MSDECRVSSVEMNAANAARPRRALPVTRHPSHATRHSSAFTLLELLVVISILGIMAALTVPVLKNFGRSDATLGGSRQLLDGVARARQLAMSHRTTVYMIFVPPNFWTNGNLPAGLNTAWFGSLTLAQQTATTNLADKQLTGYNFVASGAIGDQPGNHPWHYFDQWQELPEGTFIALAKFTNSPTQYNPSRDPVDPVTSTVLINILNGFNYANIFPFPAEINPVPANTMPLLPYVAFNYLGQLTVDGQNLAPGDEYIPLAHGTVMAVKDPVTRALWLPATPNNSPDVSENPPGNSTNSAYTIVHVDRLTGRAVLEFQKLQ